MFKRKILSLFVAMTMAVTMSLVAVTPAAAAAALVTTDKADYAPGETVVITGSGFSVGGSVLVEVTRPDASIVHWDPVTSTFVPGGETVTADLAGGFKYNYKLDGIWGTYTVKATDGVNTATTTFTDSPTPIMDGLPAQTVGTSQTVTWACPWTGVKEYEVQASTRQDFSPVFASAKVPNTAPLSYTFIGLTNVPATTYYYRVASINPSNQYSSWSNVVSSTQVSIAAPLSVTTTSLANGQISSVYSQTLAASGGVTPYTWSITVGTLPAGLTLNATTGVISGTPTAAGSSSFTVQAADSQVPAATATQALSITVVDTTPPAAPTGLKATPGNAVVNLTWNANVEPDLAGYKVYYGTIPGVYGAPIDVGNVAAYQLPSLINGITYYIAVSAYDTSINESVKSTEIAATPTTAPILRYDDASPAIVYTGTWATWENALPSGGTIKYSNTTGSSASFTFTGTSVKYIESTQSNRGIAKVYIDGVPITDGNTALPGDTGTNKSGIDLYSATAFWNVVVYQKSGLALGAHTVKVEVTGLKNAASSGTFVCVDAFESDAALTRYEDISSAVSFSGSWTTWADSHPSGGSLKFSNMVGDTATAVFYGTSVTWIESKQANRGIAKVYIDGVPVTDGDTALAGDTGTNKSGVDLYSSTALWQQIVYQKSGLAPGYHTIKVEVTGLKNAASSGTYVCVDAFESQGAFARFEDTSTYITWTGTWSLWSNPDYPSGGGIRYSTTAGSTATFAFTGGNVSWIEAKQGNRGIAKVYIDGVPVTDGDTALSGDTGTNKSGINLYSGPALWRQAVYTKSGLAPGTHTIKIEVTGLTTGSATNIGVDAFDVW